MNDYTVHNEPDFAPVYEPEGDVTIDKMVLRALLDLATGSMDFGSGFWDNEQVEIARKVAVVLGVDPNDVTPQNFKCTYGPHKWLSFTQRGKQHTICQNCSKIKPEDGE